MPLLSTSIQQSCSVVWYKRMCCVHFLNVKLLPFLCHLQLPTQTIPLCITTWHRFHQFQAQAELYVVMCDGFSTDCWWTCWHRDIWILHHASNLPSTPLQAKTHGASRFDAFFFSFPLILLFLHPALSLSSRRSSDSSCAWSLSLPLCPGKKSATSLNLDSDLVHCLCTVLSLRELHSRTCLIGLVHDH